MHSATQLNSTQLNSNLNSFKIFSSFFDAVKNRLPRISLNARNYLNYAFNFEIISRNKNLKYAILSYGDEVKAKLTVGANESKYELDDKYGIFEQGKVVNSLLFKIIN